MAQTSYRISEARKHFAEVLERAGQGEEIIIMRCNEIYARIGQADGGKRPFGLLRQRGLPDHLFDVFDLGRARRMTACAIKGLEQDIKLNKTLWILGEKMAR
jgi:antitoxin (DNA-binding transcriptional repressor) of toxin-antitoxin stability system